jgi:toxin ParE1/3/4
VKLDLSEEAARDLDEILNYSIRLWGVARAFGYIEDIDARLKALAREEMSGVRADEISPGLRRQLAGSHAIWFRIEGDRLKVVRVLHQSRDPGEWVG